MSRYFGFVGDEVHDYRYKKHPQGEGWYSFYLGDHLICTLIKNWQKNWSVIVDGPIDDAPRLVDGFVNRHKAIDYALKVNKLTKERYGRK